MTPRILITVSRTWSEWSTMRTALEKVWAELPGAVLVHGDNPKGDRQAAAMWRALGGRDEPWPADWDHCGTDCRHTPARTSSGRNYCPYAGFRRNIGMVESQQTVAMCLAFINKASKGASHCAQLAEDAGIPVVRYAQGRTSDQARTEP